MRHRLLYRDAPGGSDVASSAATFGDSRVTADVELGGARVPTDDTERPHDERPAPTTGDRRLLAIGCVVAGVLTFASSSTLVKWADTPGPTVAFWRLLFSALLWWAALAVLRVRHGRALPSRRTWRLAAPAGILFGLNLTAFFTAVTRTTVAHAEFIGALSPLLLVPAGVLFFGERADARALLFGVVSLGGLAIVLLTDGGNTSATFEGDVLALLGVLAWSAYLVTGRRARAESDVCDLMAIVMTTGFLVAAPVTAVMAGDGFWPVPARGWLTSLLLAALTGMLAHGLIAFAQREVDIATIGILQVSQPALAVCWASVLIGEDVGRAQIPGMVLVIAGLVGFTILSQRRARVLASPPATAVGTLPHDGDDN